MSEGATDACAAKAKELFWEGGQSSGAWACMRCARIHGERTPAEKCCEPIKCSFCGGEVPEFRLTICPPCAQKHESERKDRVWSAAKPVPIEEAGEYLWPEGAENIVTREDAAQMAKDGECARFYATTRVELSLCAEGILEHAVDEWHEDAMSDVRLGGDVESLQAVLDTWVKENPHECWFADETRKVVFAQNGDD